MSVLNNSCKATPWDAIAVTNGGKRQTQRIIIQGNTIESSGTSSLGGSGIVVYDDPTGDGISDFTIAHNTISTAALMEFGSMLPLNRTLFMTAKS